MFKALLIVPYPELEEIVLNVYENMLTDKGIQVDILVKRAEDIARDLDLHEYNVVIGRGHTAKILRSLTANIPVIEIPITGYDILRGVEEVRKIYASKKIAIFLSDVRNHDAALLSAVSGLDIQTFVVPDIKRIPSIVEKAAADGYDTVIGGYSAKTAADRIGLHSFTINTGEEAVVQVLKEALNIMHSLEKERERTKLYQTVTQASKEGILYVNHGGIIEMINSKGLQMLTSSLETIHNQKLCEAYPYLDSLFQKGMNRKKPILNELLEVEENKITFDFVPVLVGDSVAGIVITCQSVTKIQQIETQIRKKLSEKGLVAKYHFSDIIHRSEIMEETIFLAQRYAAVSSNIFIVGETGTGKELMAQGIHNVSERKNKPFVAVNCAALPENLLESELFGYADGAFTGSRRGGKIGLVEQAHQGTLFLDEISELPINFQGKLLRVLQEKQVRRIGDDRVIDVDVRIIAATNRNLKQQVKEGKFRQDLLYRLDILKLYIPALRERREDITLIFQNSIKKYNKRFGRDISGCTKEAEEALCNYPFEGNIRELSNIAERLCVMARDNIIDERLMRAALYPDDVEVPIYGTPDIQDREDRGAGESRLESERERIVDALRKTEGKKTEAAKLLQMDRSTLWRKMKHYQIHW